ncbi:MAG: hypothetical protein R3D62_19640 [Xanthobacteraceae bacterium]
MFRSALLLAAAVAITFTAATGAAEAGKRHFKVFDQESGGTIFDDGKLDGKACVFGKDTEFDKATGTIKVVPKLKCNFDKF